MSLYRKAEP
jgi:chromosome segregation ATPase